ncbi:hypothetical protein ACFYMR_29645 [Streptomyces albogriseolus]|uniref:hypothetical protein n=1 Tax=Streptomyces albogriseolus TaxID=1887 RepID=UPI003688C24F
MSTTAFRVRVLYLNQPAGLDAEWLFASAHLPKARFAAHGGRLGHADRVHRA